ncbi:hypothetical protein CcCBS67573_g08871 [Chytriomyces confervae]|uniref:glutathione gamma-glutamylcysteinyltransferase n=1 Tax=Chytriomyces confervae TaxID=246404 RepID=A0A507EDT0_9FUNG|nr:hypothetical protein HDU80_000992 [Chytriomyces hyalinus]TPX62001.1 hypothetical protein CcCBS67573_g08871 [Chytriomyces confervae]
MNDVIPCERSPHAPPKNSAFRTLARNALMSVIVIVASPVLLACAVVYRNYTYQHFIKVSKPTIQDNSLYKNEQKARQILANQPNLSLFKHAAEFQVREGYCAPTTGHMILNSMPNTSVDFSSDKIQFGPAVCAKLAARIDEIAFSIGTKTFSTVVYGSEGFHAFTQALEKVNDPRYRVSVNFVRGPLFGKPFPQFLLPHNLLIAFIGGHFSPIVGYDPQEQIVAVFDVNEEYGLFLVDAKRLFDAVDTYDIQSKKSRGLIVTDLR